MLFSDSDFPLSYFQIILQTFKESGFVYYV